MAPSYLHPGSHTFPTPSTTPLSHSTDPSSANPHFALKLIFFCSLFSLASCLISARFQRSASDPDIEDGETIFTLDEEWHRASRSPLAEHGYSQANNEQEGLWDGEPPPLYEEGTGMSPPYEAEPLLGDYVDVVLPRYEDAVGLKVSVIDASA